MILTLRNCALEQSFDISEMDLLTDAAERNGDAAGACPCRSSDTMDIAFGLIRHIIIDDVRNTGDINSS